MLNQRSDKVELLRIAEAVASEKSIDKEIILSTMETAIQKAARTKFGSENNIRAKIDRETGDISLYKILTIVDSPENFDTEISLEHAIKLKNKKCDAILLNDISNAGIGLNSDYNEVHLITKDNTEKIEKNTKQIIAEKIINKLAKYFFISS